MNNIELRWLEQKTSKQLMNEHGFYYDETVRTLQYRVKYDKTIWSLPAGVTPSFHQELVWGEWINVPVVEG